LGSSLVIKILSISTAKFAPSGNVVKDRTVEDPDPVPFGCCFFPVFNFCFDALESSWPLPNL
jgi:hypothetical protein